LTLQVAGEIAEWLDGCGSSVDSSGIGAGCFYGQGGLGIMGELTVGEIDDRFIWNLGFSITIRIPSGIAFGIPFP
jgi:hypothetical protein